MILTQTSGGLASTQTRNYPNPTGLGELTAIPASVDGGSPVVGTFYDSDILEYSGGATWADFLASPVAGAAVTNLNPEIATLDEANRLNRIADGIGFVEFSQGTTKTLRRYNTTANDSANLGFVGYTSGTVAGHLEDQVVALIESDITKRDLNYFSGFTANASAFSKNPNCWARSVDLSCVAVDTPATLITPRHVVVAEHYHTLGPMRFVTPEGVIRAVTPIGESGTIYDQKVLTLSANVTGCSPVKVGGDWLTQTVGSSYYCGGLVLSVNRHREVGLSLFGNPIALLPSSAPTTYNGSAITGRTSLSIFHDAVAAYYHPTIASEIDLTLTPVSGDSGSPCFARVGNDLVLLTCWLTSNSGPCTWMGSGNNQVLNQMILEADTNAGISTGYTVTVAPDPTA